MTQHKKSEKTENAKTPTKITKKSEKTSGDSNNFDKMLQEIRKQFNNESVLFLDESQDFITDIKVASTGSFALNQALGCGGLPFGRIVEVFGPEASGKTTVALHALASAQRDHGFPCGYIDMEHAMDPKYAQKIGVKIEDMFFSQPENGEQALDLAQKMIEVGLKFIVIDSVSALVPKAELEGDMEGGQLGGQARMMSKFLRRLVPATHKKKAILLFVNQLRQKIAVRYGSPETTSGGQALKYYASVRIDIRKSSEIKDPKTQTIIGVHSKAKVVKNKLAPPLTTAEFQIIYGKGISKTAEILDLGEKYGLIRKSGIWYFLSSGDPESDIQIGQGTEQAKNWLEENPDHANDLYQQISQKMFFNK